MASRANALVIKPLGEMAAALSRYGATLFKPPQDTIRGLSDDAFGSPLQPVRPFAPAGTEPRGFQFWGGQNLTFTPRPDAEFSAAYLKYLATYPLARICLEQVKDSICQTPSEIQARPRPGETKKQAAKRSHGDQVLVALNRFFEYPDREHAWPDWLRPMLDDMLVIDAPAILIRKTFGGQVVELPVLRGDSIVRYIDENGFTPMAPQPAYAQLWWGMPLVNLSTDQLVYRPRNLVPRNTVSSQLYGMSPVEQLAAEIEVGIQRLAFVLAYYTQGSIPDVLQVVPKGTSEDSIGQAMEWMNSSLAGNLAARRQWRMVQGFNEPGKDDQIIFPKEKLLADAYDEMHMRRIAFGIGTSPQRLMKAMNRASAQQSDEAANIEGTLPYLNWLKASVMDYLIQRVFGYPDYEWVADPFNEPDLVKQSNALKVLVGGAIFRPNEARERLGEEPDPAPEANQLGVITAAGFVPIGMAAAQAGATTDEKGRTTVAQTDAEKQLAAAKEKKPGAKDDKGNDDDAPPVDAKSKPNGAAGKATPAPDRAVSGFAAGAVPELQVNYGVPIPVVYGKRRVAIAKRRPTIRVDRLLPGAIVAKHSLERTLGARFKVMRRKTTKALARAVGADHAHLAAATKADGKVRLQSVQLNLAPADALRLIAVGRGVADADLAPKGREAKPHVTVLFGLAPEVTAAQVNELTRGVGDIVVTLGAFEAFPEGNDGVPLVIRVESEKLRTLHARLAALPHTTTWPDYRPHISVAYLKAEASGAYEERRYPLAGAELTLGDLVFSGADRATQPLAKDETQDETLNKILRSLAAEWRQVADDAQDDYEGATLAGAAAGSLELDISADDMLSAINDVARDWAAKRAAELVGMRRTAAGKLVANPDARWAITDTTRDKLRLIIADAFAGERTLGAIEERIAAAGVFSDLRAAMIANTEIARAQAQGNLTSWRESGLVKLVAWQLSADHDHDDVCDDNEDGSPYPVDDAPDLPAHPNCMCALVLADEDEGEAE